MEGGKTIFASTADIGWGAQASLMVPSSVEQAADLEDLARLTP